MVDTTGRVFKDGAWVDVWPVDKRLWIIKNGILKIPFDMFDSQQLSDRVRIIRAYDNAAGIKSINHISTVGYSVMKIKCASASGPDRMLFYVRPTQGSDTGAKYNILYNISTSVNTYSVSGLVDMSGFFEIYQYSNVGKKDVFDLWFE